jgi:rare lipoprotein A
MPACPGLRASVLVRTALLALACAAIPAGTAFAQQRQAPIVFAGQDAPAQPAMMTASVEPRLTGGDETSYGYGGAGRPRAAAVIDIRRAGAQQESAQRAEPAPAAAPSRHAEQGAPAWLERERVGPPYEANGRWYVPTPEPGYEQTGMASWYGPTFHGRATASGETFDQEAMTAAHPTLPIPSLVQVTNLENGREIIVRVNDRGPFVGERLIDLSRRSAEVLGFESAGQTRVHIRYLGPAPRHVNTDGSSAPAPINAAPLLASAPSALSPSPTTSADGPMSLLPPEAAASEFAAAPAIEAAGPAVVDVRQTAGGELFRVRLGPLNSREEAEAARRTLADLGYGNTILASR